MSMTPEQWDRLIARLARETYEDAMRDTDYIFIAETAASHVDVYRMLHPELPVWAEHPVGLGYVFERDPVRHTAIGYRLVRPPEICTLLMEIHES